MAKLTGHIGAHWRVVSVGPVNILWFEALM